MGVNGDIGLLRGPKAAEPKGFSLSSFKDSSGARVENSKGWCESVVVPIYENYDTHVKTTEESFW